MKKVIVDTDVLVDYLRTSQGDLPKLMASQAIGSIELAISTVTIMELYAVRFRTGEKEVLEKFYLLLKWPLLIESWRFLLGNTNERRNLICICLTL